MDANALCELLRFADNVDARHIRLSDDVVTCTGTTLEFLVRQGWIVENDDLWSITPTGRLWIRTVGYPYDPVKFYEHGGATFLVHTRVNHDELLVWHSGSFVSITPARLPLHSPAPYVLRRDAELVETSAGPDPGDALATACGC